MSLLIKNIILNNQKQDIYIEKNKIAKIGKNLDIKAREKINGKGEKAVIPGLINCHTHSAMTLFRGYSDDLPLKDWLEKKIWPLEKKLTEEDIYWGTKLACLEMIKTGTTCFNDMYWFEEASIEAIKEMGIRAVIGLVLLDFLPLGSKEHIEKLWKKINHVRFVKQLSNRVKIKKLEIIKLAIAPHSIYAVSKENLIWAKNFAKRNNLILHIHISETKKEVKDCQRQYKLRPVEYLDKIGFLGKNVVLAHSVWLSDKEIKILGKRNCSAVYCPCSNMKLGIGEIFPYQKLKKAKVNICLGTDGPASNNNLDLFEEMKIGSLLQKHKEKNPTTPKAKEVLNWTTVNGANALKINTGSLQRGKLADLILIDINQLSFVPGFNFNSDLVYSTSGNCVSDLICNGKILMREREIKGEKEIIKKTRKISQ